MVKGVRNGEFLFEQIYQYVLRKIEQKEWNEHQKLPSIRQLAKEMNVHRLTVHKAYQLLKKNEVIYVKDKIGYYVQSNGTKQTENLENPIVSSYVQKNHLSEIHQVPVTYNFSQALIDPNLLPNHFLSDYVKKVFDLYPKVLSSYSTVQGDLELRASLTKYFINQYKKHIDATELLITSGSQQAIHIIAEAFVKAKDTILLERPSYSPAIDIFIEKGAKIISVDIHSNGYDLDQVEYLMKHYKPRLFYLNPTFHNPTGYTVPNSQRKQLVELAEKYRCLLVEDDVYHDIYFVGKPPPPIYTYDTVGTVIYVRSFCKYISPGLRIAAIICHSSLLQSLMIVKSLTDNGSPLLNQKIFLHYFSSKRMQQHLEKLRIAISIRKEIMEEELSVTNWQWTSPNGGLNLWVQLPQHISIEKLLTKCFEHSISFVPGQICDPLKQQTSWIRLSYSYINEHQLRDGLKSFVEVVKSLEE
ncbi:aminotransferase-like domain-containing protein [Heyndrickxia oleronia]|uniref:aminotransferase-like domain-containing protein n=1 Tax=Heyndrickxia oleronia TaxID=38875 RepID=UPI0007170E74|nr:PLP-dependent aminotransferase family protein [Heyndrickxia oleronia]MBU5210703.1 PLP-dependent aminotransferase family protein [Heyndrickxia oleronia]NYV67863.1 PLP-dependent aminotransferase family protein [Bacillus sp. Gen3]OJH19126.1 GntR family transcriptional regulator [Bacillus obstructivus]